MDQKLRSLMWFLRWREVNQRKVRYDSLCRELYLIASKGLKLGWLATSSTQVKEIPIRLEAENRTEVFKAEVPKGFIFLTKEGRKVLNDSVC